MPETEMKIAKPDKPEGPTSQCAWKLATLAKHAIARKLKKIWPVWNMIAGFETIISSKGTIACPPLPIPPDIEVDIGAGDF
jgi:hypothetical protein